MEVRYKNDFIAAAEKKYVTDLENTAHPSGCHDIIYYGHHYMYDPELAHMLNDYQIALPGIMSAVGMTGIAGNLTEFVYIYLYGFIMLVFPIIAIIILGNKLLAHYIDSGSMGVLLATPNSRLKILLTQLLSMLAGITLLIVLITAIGIGTCEGLFSGELDIPLFLKLNAALLLFHLMLGGIAFLPACIFNDSNGIFPLEPGCWSYFSSFRCWEIREEIWNFSVILPLLPSFPEKILWMEMEKFS